MGGATFTEDLGGLNAMGYLKLLWVIVEIAVSDEIAFHAYWQFQVLGLVFQACCMCSRGGANL